MNEATQEQELPQKTATLGQIRKILDYLQSVPSEEVQKRLPRIAEAIKNPSDEAAVEIHRNRARWELLEALGFEGIYITVPDWPCPNYDDGSYEISFWKDGYGEIHHGYVALNPRDKGKFLFSAKFFKPERSEFFANMEGLLRMMGIDLKLSPRGFWHMRLLGDGRCYVLSYDRK